MLCPNCGANNADGAPTCASCGAPLAANPGAVPPGAAAPYSPGPAPSFPAAPVYRAATPVRQAPPAAAVLIPNYLIPSILMTVFCCMPAGIVGIIYASQVNTKLVMGDLQGAAAASNTAKVWCLVGLCLGLVPALLGVLYFILVVVIDIAGAGANH